MLSVIAGWVTAEVGRQPYTVYGLLRTADSVSPVTAEAVGTSLIVFVFVYGVVFTAGMFYMLQLAVKGPGAEDAPSEASDRRPVLATLLGTRRDGDRGEEPGGGGWTV